MELGQIHHVEYYVNDLKRSNEFWSWFLEGFAYKKMSEWEAGISWEHSSGTYLVFVQVEKEFLNSQNTRHGNGLNHLAFMGHSEEHLDNLQKTLESKGAKILKRKEKYLCFEDPNGFAVEVYSPA